MWWTVISPAIAVGIVVYWVYKINLWRNGAPRAAEGGRPTAVRSPSRHFG
jgi:hypothetical protein